MMRQLWIAMAATTMVACTSNEQRQATETDEQQNVVIETIMARRSVRKYKEQPVEREKLQQIVACGIQAPNGMNRQPWEVRVMDSRAYIDSLTALFRIANPQMASDADFHNMFRNAQAVIFIATTQEGTSQIDCGLLGENMILAAQSLGLGTCCLGGPIRFMKDAPEAQPYVERLNFSEGYELLYAIGVGYPDETPDAKLRDTTKVQFID
jgi:nitroreductase